MATEVLRPNGAGDDIGTEHNNITGGDGTKYGVTSDDLDTSYIGNTSTNKTCADAMTLGDPATVTASDSIDSIDVRWRARTESSATGSGRPGVRLGGTTVWGTTQSSIPTSATNYETTAIARPGGGSWTFADLADLQVTIETTRNGNNIRVFELYVDINYTVGGAAPKSPPPVPAVRGVLHALVR